MATYIIIIFISFLVILIIRVAIRNRKKEESKLSVFDHPSNFKKQPIEMVNSTSVKNDKNTSNQVDFIDHLKKDDNL